MLAVAFEDFFWYPLARLIGNRCYKEALVMAGWQEVAKVIGMLAVIFLAGRLMPKLGIFVS